MNNEEIIKTLFEKNSSMKGTNLLNELLQNPKFKLVIEKGILTGKITGFSEDFFLKMEKQNCRSYSSLRKIFEDGKNIGTCNQTSTLISYMFNDANLLGGVNSFFVGTPASDDGRHSWLETKNILIDTSLMLFIDKSFAEDMGYKENLRISQSDLRKNKLYTIAKDYACDYSLNQTKNIL